MRRQRCRGRFSWPGGRTMRSRRAPAPPPIQPVRADAPPDLRSSGVSSPGPLPCCSPPPAAAGLASPPPLRAELLGDLSKRLESRRIVEDLLEHDLGARHPPHVAVEELVA